MFGDYTPFGRRRDAAVRAALGDIPLEATGSPYLVSPGRVTKDDGTPYKVFTPYFNAWRQHGWRAPAKSGPKSANWIDPAEVSGGVDIPDAGAELELPAGEKAGRRQWKKFVDNGLDGYADDRDRPDLDATSRMSAHLKFGTIHPRTMAVDLGGGKAHRRICGSWRSATSMPRCCTGGQAACGGTGTHPSTRSRSTMTATPSGCSRRGRPAAPGSRSSTRACVSSPKPAGCITGCG